MQLPIITENDAFDLLLDSLGPFHTNTKRGRGEEGKGLAEPKNGIRLRAKCSYHNKLCILYN